MIVAVNIDKLIPEIEQGINEIIEECNLTREKLEIVLPECSYYEKVFNIEKPKNIQLSCCGVDVIYGHLKEDTKFVIRQKLKYNFEEQAKKEGAKILKIPKVKGDDD